MRRRTRFERIRGNIVGFLFGILAAVPLSAQAQTTTWVAFDPSQPAPVNQPPTDPASASLSASAVPSDALAASAAALPSGVAVGRTPGSFGVSATGTANYTIPIWTPPGIAGLGPSLALSYSSASGDGLYGVGWNLAGLSTIERCQKTYGQDSFSAAVILTSADLFCIDGAKLRSFGGTTYGADGAQYQTELADFSLVISHGAAGTGPAWFEVHAKNGLIYQYGNTTDSALLATGAATVLTWALNRITDRFGNHVDFAYTNDTTDQVLRISAITYTTPGTTTGVQTTPNYQVSFTYVSNTGTIPGGFVAGAQFMEPNLAQTITISAWNGSAYAAVKTYNLNYTLGTATRRSQLTSIQECSPTQCFPATIVTYQNGTVGWGSAVTSSGSFANLNNSFVLDLNGDGLDDIVIGTQYWLGSSTGGFSGPYSIGVTLGSNTVPIDYNGDGKMDLMTSNSSGNWRILFFQSAGSAFTYTDTTTPAPPAGTGPMVLTGDVDGDGRDDVIYLVSGGSQWQSPDIIYYRLNTGSGFGPQTVLRQLASSTCTVCYKFTLTPLGQWNAYSYSTRSRRPDFNGDGRIDFFVNIVRCVIGDSGCTSPVYNWTLFVSDATTVSYDQLAVVNYGATGLASNLRPPLIGDFNGDGCSDIAYNTGVGSYWMLQFGTCYRSGAAGILSAAVNTGVTAYDIYPIAIDWDGDGRDDIVEPNATSGGYFGVFHSTGTTLQAWASTGIAYNNSDTVTNIIDVADVNGDGQSDIVYATTSSSTPTVLPHANGSVAADLATAFTDGFGVTYSPSYTHLTNSSVYSKGTGASFPEQDLTTSGTVVGSFTGTDGIGGTYTVSKTYTQLRRDLQRRTTEGFGSVRTVDNRDGLYRYQYFAQLFPKSGMVSEQKVLQSDNSTTISDVVNTLSSQTLDATYKRYFPYASQSVAYGYEVGGAINGQLITQKATTVAYSGANGFTYGNPSQISTSTVDKDPNSPWLNNTFTDTVNITPYEVGGTGSTGWCIHLSSQISETRTQPSGASLTHTTSYGVNANSQCEVDSQTVEPSSSVDKVVTAYSYTDGCGNVNTTTVTGLNPDGTAMTGRSTGRAFGTHCIFPETITNALGQSGALTYRYDLGLPVTAVDANNLQTSWTFNDLGQKILEQRPDGTQVGYNLTACSGAACLGDSTLRYEVRLSQKDSSGSHATFWYSDEYFDAFGRGRYSKPLQTNAVQTQSAITYDSAGRVAASTNPSGNGYSSYSVTMNYDAIGRLKQEYRPISSTNATLEYANYGYQGRTQTITDPRGYTTTKRFDVIGELLRMVDPDGSSTTQYAYGPFGSLVSLTDAGGNAVTASYDALGYLLIGTSDGDRGSWTYQFDSLGELRNVRDAKTAAPTWTQQFTYDALARPLTRIEPPRLLRRLFVESHAA